MCATHYGSFQVRAGSRGAEGVCVDRQDLELSLSNCLLGAPPCARYSEVQSPTCGYIIPILQRGRLRLREAK